MLRNKAFVKKTRKGGVVKVSREHYLRDDVWCGSEVCKKCEGEGTRNITSTLRSSACCVGHAACCSPDNWHPMFHFNTDKALQREPQLRSKVAPYPHYIIPDTNVVLHQV
jgi:exosome complex exonuclease DIS3/RRP44